MIVAITPFAQFQFRVTTSSVKYGGGIFPGGYILEGIYLGGTFPVGNFPGGNFQVGIFSGENFLES